MHFLGLFDTTVRASRCPPGLFRSHTAALKVILQQRQVRVDLARQIPLRGSTEKEILELGEMPPPASRMAFTAFSSSSPAPARAGNAEATARAHVNNVMSFIVQPLVSGNR